MNRYFKCISPQIVRIAGVQVHNIPGIPDPGFSWEFSDKSEYFLEVVEDSVLDGNTEIRVYHGKSYVAPKRLSKIKIVFYVDMNIVKNGLAKYFMEIDESYFSAKEFGVI